MPRVLRAEGRGLTAWPRNRTESFRQDAEPASYTATPWNCTAAILASWATSQ